MGSAVLTMYDEEKWRPSAILIDSVRLQCFMVESLSRSD
jgi:hypothetical protein